jgi:hypothetical protein
MSLFIEIFYLLIVSASAVAIYFKFLDKKLDKALDNFFASWNTEAKDMKEIRKIQKVKMK